MSQGLWFMESVTCLGAMNPSGGVFPSLASPLILVPVWTLGVDNKANVCIQSHNYEGVYSLSTRSIVQVMVLPTVEALPQTPVC